MERLDKFLCDSGLGTRSQVKLLLKTGRVTLDGRAEKDGSRKIDPQCQKIALDGEVLGGKRRLVVMLNKPAGYVTATEDAQQKTVMELLPRQWAHLDLKPVGRLDKETEGLLLLPTMAICSTGSSARKRKCRKSTTPDTRDRPGRRMCRPSPGG